MSTSVSIPAHLVSSPWLVFSTYPTETEAIDYFSFNPHPQWRSSEPSDDEEDEEDEDDVENHSGYDSPDDARFEIYEQDKFNQCKKPQGLRLKPASDEVWSEEDDDDEEGEDHWSDDGSSFAGTSDRTLVDFEFDESPPTTPGGDWTYAASTEAAPLPSVCSPLSEYTPFARSAITSDGGTRSNSPMSLSSSFSCSTGVSHTFPLTPIQETPSVHARVTSSSYSSHSREFTMVLPPLKKRFSLSSSSDMKVRPMRTSFIRPDVGDIPVHKAQGRKESVHVDTPFPSF
ncbi:hypothetical protein [Phaffia rhodozyma]|uniref:Uncharacterized protein n=1 Tax=Phaffia rhodozyma TaxID=264483 RepID=A0A0F7SWH0_PHARH|nr:hypothetical protein [Phaffia rhodozyma]